MTQTGHTDPGQRRLAVAILDLARRDAEQGHNGRNAVDARTFLLGHTDQRHLLDHWAGIIGLPTDMIIKWAVSKGYQVGRVRTTPRPIQRLTRSAYVHTAAATPIRWLNPLRHRRRADNP